MLSYETLDAIADVYIPLLAVITLAFIVRALIIGQRRIAGLRLLTVSAVLTIAYGLMFIDGRFNIWPRFGLDYSTHTAVALVLVIFLAVNKPKFTVIWLSSLIFYVLLMLYQHYHTVSDIVVTAAIVFLPSWLAVARLYDLWPFSTSNSPRNRARKSGAMHN